jgi:Alginate lyase
MNPNLEYAEYHPGGPNTSSSGIMRGMVFRDTVDSILRLNTDGGTKKWFTQYLNWLLNSAKGRQESQCVNNHGTWYNLQVVSIANFIGRIDIAKDVVNSALPRLMREQFQPDGSQPFENIRHDPAGYIRLNNDGISRLKEFQRRLA